MDWGAEKKRIEDAANNIRTLLDMARLQVRNLESEMLRLEGEYRLVNRLAEEELASRQEVKTDVTSSDGGEASGRLDKDGGASALRGF